MSIEELKARWEEAAAKGDHATCYSIKQEIEALEHQAAVDAVQRKAKAEAARIAEAVEDAAATLRAIENHHGIRRTTASCWRTSKPPRGASSICLPASVWNSRG